MSKFVWWVNISTVFVIFTMMLGLSLKKKQKTTVEIEISVYTDKSRNTSGIFTILETILKTSSLLFYHYDQAF
jgi:hypothetical protein